MNMLKSLDHPLPTLTAVTSSDTLSSTKKFPWLQRTSNSLINVTVILQKFIKMRGWNRVSLINESYSMSKGVAAALTKELESANIEIANAPTLREMNSPKFVDDRSIIQD
jgi:ABC-type branched-subunit amino acid transport system substrate-binding protein